MRCYMLGDHNFITSFFSPQHKNPQSSFDKCNLKLESIINNYKNIKKYLNNMKKQILTINTKKKEVMKAFIDALEESIK